MSGKSEKQFYPDAPVKYLFLDEKSGNMKAVLIKICMTEVIYIYLHNSQEKINCSSKKALQESTLWTRSSHQLLRAARIRKRCIVSHSHLFLTRDSLASLLDLQKDSA